MENSKLMSFSFEESYLTHKLRVQKNSFFKRLTKKSSKLFFRGGDLISVEPQTSGLHEPIQTSLIEHFSKIGFDDFLIDVGANIGLTTCQTGHFFKKVHLYEPNPYCCKIIEVNTMIAFPHVHYEIHPFGLGTENKKATLTVPRQNWGGAFIQDAENSYDEKTLANKDSFENIEESNYVKVDIEIRETASEMKNVFEALVADKGKRGVIKIDVEGYEPSVLKGIAKSIPSELEVFILFESWNADFHMDDILKSFAGRAKPYRLVHTPPWKKNWPKFMNIFFLLLNKKYKNTIQENTSNNWAGDIILKVTRCLHN
jgi:FkbM family methyltransferase